MKKFLMGNEAIAMGALAAGVNVVSGYPGTPSSEVLETIAKNNDGSVYVEWSVNEKAGMEVAAGAAYAGARTLVTMKQVGLNVASDPLMSLEYVGVKGGMVVLVADDPGPISSQTEQDTRKFAQFSKLPCFDPSNAQEAYDMIQKAFELSEKYQTPVFLRPTTRVCHGYFVVDLKEKEEYYVNKPEGFVKDSSRWVIFPRLSKINHEKIEKRNVVLSDEFSDCSCNRIESCEAGSNLGIVTGGISYTYVKEAIKSTGANVNVFKVSTPFPFPERKCLEFLKDVKEVLCVEELEPVLEEMITCVAGKYHLDVTVHGKKDGRICLSGENTIDSVKEAVASFANVELPKADDPLADAPKLPVRPPVLCAGCPHRASFYAVKQAMKGKKTVFCGDIGCYTLGNAMPLDMVDTCLCMGAGLGIAQGIGHVEPDTSCFAFVGDSTFFASAITGAVNAVYNQSNMTLVILDNSTTAMTGHQPHPGTGRTMMGQVVDRIDIEAVLRGIGLSTVVTVNPLELDKAIATVSEVAAKPGVKAIIFKSPCIAIVKQKTECMMVNESCIGCGKCIREIGCPALSMTADKKAVIDTNLCTGCGLCAQLCPTGSIKKPSEGGAQ